MSESRAEYYREYRRRKKTESGSTESEFVVTALHDVAQQLQQTVRQLAEITERLTSVAQQMQQTSQQMTDVAQQLQHVAQQFSQQNATVANDVSAKFCDELEAFQGDGVAQQSQQSVAQHDVTDDEPKRKGSFPPSFPPSHPPQTPPYSSPLLSPQSPKEKGAKKFSISSGKKQEEQTSSPDPDEIADDPNAPLVVSAKKSDRDFATWQEYIDGMNEIMAETQSDSLMDAFCNWVEYKRERDINEFYTRRGMNAEVKRFIKRHFEEFNVAEAVNRAIANNWQGWDHKL